MEKFMYLFRGNPQPASPLSPEQMEQVMKKWVNWTGSLKKDGHMEKGGERLQGSGKVVRSQSKTVSDGPYIEVKDAIQGYVMIQAQNMDQAVELAKGCPILDYDGSVEIRPLWAM
jgi:hypothetical protein